MTILVSGFINLIGLILIAIVFLYERKFCNKEQLEVRVFNALLLFTALALVCDFLGYLPGNSGGLLRYIAQVSIFIFFIALLLAGSLWLLYVDLQLVSNGQLRPHQWLYFIPACCGSILVAINIKTHWFYSFNVAHIYCHGPLYPLLLAPFIAVTVCSVVVVLIGSKRDSRLHSREAYSMLYFIIPQVAGITLQLFISGFSPLAVSMALSLLIIFIQRQETLVMHDSLTKLNNHRAFASYLEQRLGGLPPRQQFFLVMIDADRFKEINDTFGHSRGDEALIKIADVLRGVSHKDDLITRMGGDEFTIVGQRANEDEVLAFCQDIDRAIEEENRYSSNSYQLSVSWGYALYDSAIHHNVDQLIHAADQAMYINKETTSGY